MYYQVSNTCFISSGKRKKKKVGVYGVECRMQSAKCQLVMYSAQKHNIFVDFGGFALKKN